MSDIVAAFVTNIRNAFRQTDGVALASLFQPLAEGQDILCDALHVRLAVIIRIHQPHAA